MDRYTKYQIIASICVALFIVSTAMYILANNTIIYDKCYDEYYQENSESTHQISMRPAEASLYYRQLNESFTNFFDDDYDISGYELTKDNVQKLNELKTYYRMSVIVSIITFVVSCYSIRIISKRRMYMPLVYGGLLAALGTAMNSLILIFSDNKIISGIRNMVFEMEYGYFSEGDILYTIIPPEYARWLFVTYIVLVLILIIFMVLLRQVIMFLGRPHKF